MSEAENSIEWIIQVAITEVRVSITNKIGRELTQNESRAIAAIIDSEHFWARAEEMKMFVQHKSTNDLLEMLNSIEKRYRALGKDAFVNTSETESTLRSRHCGICNGSGDCYCIRKGSGTAVDCPRCAGDAKCRHCRGLGTI